MTWRSEKNASVYLPHRSLRISIAEKTATYRGARILRGYTTYLIEATKCTAKLTPLQMGMGYDAFAYARFDHRAMKVASGGSYYYILRPC